MADIPDEVVEDAERLTRLAREAVDDAEAAAYRADRDDRLADHGYVARVRGSDASTTLVLYPDDWLDDEGLVRVDDIEDTSRAVEVLLDGTPDDEEWASVEEHNSALVEAVADAHGEVHAANARAFADFMGNHYSRRMERATGREIREFLDEYYPRNAWPTPEQKTAVERSISLVFDAADEEPPAF